MVGMLDFSGNSGGDPYSGLLTPEMQRMVQQRQLLGMASGLLQAGGPSRLPVSFGQALGQGLQGMQQGQDQGIQQAIQTQTAKSQLRKNNLEKLQPGEMMYDINTGKPAIGNSIFGQPITGDQAQGGATTTPTADLHGDEFLTKMPKNMADQVKALAEGRMQFPGGFALKSPYWQQMISAVSQYDPNFDAVNYNARAKTRGSFVAGQDANNITALNTAMNHAASLKDAYDNLGNTDYPSVNAAKNWLGNELNLGDIQTNTTAVGSKAHALSGELAKVFRSTGMAESDIKNWENRISTSATKAQSNEVLNSAMDLMEGRLQALASKYNQGMGTTKNGIDLLSPEAQKAYYKVRGENPGSVTAGGQQSADTPQNPNIAQNITKPSDQAVEYLKKNPHYAPQFEAKYGISAKNYLGM